MKKLQQYRIRRDWTLSELKELPSSRGLALQKDERYYFNNNLCTYKHLSPRLTTSSKCQICLVDRESNRRNNSIKTTPFKKNISNKKEMGIGTTVEGRLFEYARRRAKDKNREFNISISDVVIPNRCPILGIKIIKQWGLSQQNNSSRANNPTLDRLDSSKGYIKGNIEVISYRANILKKDGTSLEHEQIALYIQKFKKDTSS
jgi:hypothetical protein